MEVGERTWSQELKQRPWEKMVFIVTIRSRGSRGEARIERQPSAVTTKSSGLGTQGRDTSYTTCVCMSIHVEAKASF